MNPRAVVLPHPPLLFPELTGPGAVAAQPVRAACADAVRALLDDGTSTRLVLVGGGACTTRHPDGAWGTLAGYGVRLEAPAGAARSGPPTLPLSLTVGSRLLDLAAWTGPLTLQEVAVDADADECLALGARLARDLPSASWMVLADGTNRRTERAPGAFDPRAEPFDTEVTEALATGDVARLAALDAALAAELGVAGRAPWQVLAGGRPAPSSTRVRYAGAPFGVGYVVALWS